MISTRSSTLTCSVIPSRRASSVAGSPPRRVIPITGRPASRNLRTASKNTSPPFSRQARPIWSSAYEPSGISNSRRAAARSPALGIRYASGSIGLGSRISFSRGAIRRARPSPMLAAGTKIPSTSRPKSANLAALRARESGSLRSTVWMCQKRAESPRLRAASAAGMS